jgi:small subunit ribosomal protein S14
MQNLIQRDKNRRKLNILYEKKRLALKTIVYNRNLPKNIRWRACLELSDLPRNSSKTRLSNRCILTGRSKSIHRNFRISRICLRNLGNAGEICGFKKYSW